MGKKQRINLEKKKKEEEKNKQIEEQRKKEEMIKLYQLEKIKKQNDMKNQEKLVEKKELLTQKDLNSEILTLIKKQKSFIEEKKLEELVSSVYSNQVGSFTANNFELLDLFLTKSHPSKETFSIKERKKFFDAILNQAKKVKSQDKDVNILYAKVLESRGNDLMRNVSEKQIEEVKIIGYKKAIDDLEESLFVFSDAGNQKGATSTLNLFEELFAKTLTTQSAYELALYSFSLRDKNFTNDKKITTKEAKDIVVKSMLNISKIGVKLENTKEIVEALQNADKAYNLAFSYKNYSAVVEALKVMSTGYKKLGDGVKATVLNEKADFISKLSDKSKDALEENLILKSGVVSEDEVKIKQLLQKAVLDPIMKQAEAGKWINTKVFEYGVSGYLESEFIKKQLGDLYSVNNYDIALQLCFEAINLGIISSVDKNPLCSAIFCQKYPKIVEKLLKAHPEYFVDGSLILSSVGDSNTKDILDIEITKDIGYNTYFEKNITSSIESRIKNSILDPIYKIILDGAWSEKIGNHLISYLSEDYLKKILGNNLSQMPDVFNISRKLAFKYINDGIQEKKSKNLEPVDLFIKSFSELNARIKEDYSSYFKQQENNKESGNTINNLEMSVIQNITNDISNEEEVKSLGENGDEVAN
jgi:hypothetical protein